MVVRLFEALKVEAVAIRSNIQEALSSLAGAFKVFFLVNDLKHDFFFPSYLISAYLILCHSSTY